VKRGKLKKYFVHLCFSPPKNVWWEICPKFEDKKLSESFFFRNSWKKGSKKLSENCPKNSRIKNCPKVFFVRNSWKRSQSWTAPCRLGLCERLDVGELLLALDHRPLGAELGHLPRDHLPPGAPKAQRLPAKVHSSNSNPTIMSYNTSVMSSLVYCEKNTFSYIMKNDLAYFDKVNSKS
jgi:hypothetical protein